MAGFGAEGGKLEWDDLVGLRREIERVKGGV
jgi:hypothetical protein